MKVLLTKNCKSNKFNLRDSRHKLIISEVSKISSFHCFFINSDLVARFYQVLAANIKSTVPYVFRNVHIITIGGLI